ncbi:MAG TPA: Gfo/Idh/MocA family oxidoreductase [Planctomycetota bacterium]|nr:Gfo/Idh/MocA family oxidoreductase [Planctomycetota bacterium]
MKPFRLVVAGLVHDHVWSLLPQFAKVPGVEIVGGADPHAPLRQKLRREFGVTALFGEPRELFARVEADGVLVCASNAGGVPIVEAAARRGLHALVEKPMAATAPGAHRMLRAARRHGTRLMINWPIAWNPAVVRALELVEAGDIGQVFHARIHMAHQGPREAGCSPYFWKWLYDGRENGAGAIADYACYGAAIMASLWGRPGEVVGVARTLVKPRFPVDDNALIVALWPERTVLSQASWTQNPDFHEVLFLGVKGTLETSRGKLIRTHTRPEDFSHWGADRENRRELKLPGLPAGRRNGPEHFVHSLRAGTPFLKLCRAETGVMGQEIVSAGIRSERTGRRVRL